MLAREEAEQKILEKYHKNGVITEDEIMDICFDYDLEITEIDAVCNRIFSKKVIVSDYGTKEQNGSDQEYADHGHIDYEEFYNQIENEYPNMTAFIEQIRIIPPPQSREWRTLLPQAQNGNQYAKERIIKMYTRSVLRQAYTFSKMYNVDYEEAFQNGMLGLFSAIRKFDITRPDSFAAYYGLWVMQTMRRYSLPKTFICNYPVHFKEYIFKKMDIVREELDEDSFESAMEYNALEKVTNYITSTNDLPDTFSYDELLEDTITTEDTGYDIDDELTKEMQIEIITEFLNHIKEREKQVICMRYGLYDGIERTLDEVGNVMGVTRERIRQIEKKALSKLGKKVGVHTDEESEND